VIAWARSPEELEMLFEDACVLHDREALAGLFDPGAVVGSPALGRVATGRAAVTSMIDDFWAAGGTYWGCRPASFSRVRPRC
jgi:hypothetical protein